MNWIKHKKQDSVLANQRIAAKYMDGWMKDYKRDLYFVNDPEKLMSLLIQKAHDLYCEYCDDNQIQRFNTINGNVWSDHDGQVWNYIETYTSYKSEWLPKVEKQRLENQKHLAVRRNINIRGRGENRNAQPKGKRERPKSSIA